jgi:hypothetical protein
MLTLIACMFFPTFSCFYILNLTFSFILFVGNIHQPSKSHPFVFSSAMFDPFASLSDSIQYDGIQRQADKITECEYSYMVEFQVLIKHMVISEVEEEEENKKNSRLEGQQTQLQPDGILTRPTPSVIKSRSIPNRQREMLDTLCVCVGHLNQLLTYRLSVGMDMRLCVQTDLDTDAIQSTITLLLSKLHTVYGHIHRRSVTPEVVAVLRLFDIASHRHRHLTGVHDHACDPKTTEEAAQRIVRKLAGAVEPRRALKRGASNVGVYLCNALRLSDRVTCHTVTVGNTPIKQPPPDSIMGSVGRNRHRCRMGKPFSKQEASILLPTETSAPSPIQNPLFFSGSDGVVDWDAQGASHISIDRFRHLLPSNSQTVIVGGASWQRNRARVCKKSFELYLPCFALLASLPNAVLLPQRLLAMRLLSVVIASILMLSHSFVPNRQYRLERMLEPLLEAMAYINL